MINDTKDLWRDFQGWLLFFALACVGIWTANTFGSGVGYWIGIALALAALPARAFLEDIKELFKRL